MIAVAPKLFVGTTGEAVKAPAEFRIVNLARTFHYALHKWKLNEDHKEDKCYVVHEDPRIFSINWVDATEAKYFDYEGQGVHNFQKIFSFIQKFVSAMPVLIVCNKGESRAPSIAMAYLAKRTDLLSEKDFQAAQDMSGEAPVVTEEVFIKPPYGIARERFDKIYPNYYPGHGITEFLIDHWEEL